MDEGSLLLLTIVLWLFFCAIEISHESIDTLSTTLLIKMPPTIATILLLLLLN